MTNREEQSVDVPDGWVREELISGMNTIGRDEYPGASGGFKCDRCSHFVPIESVEDAVCPACGRGGLIGTIIAGAQVQTFLYPEGWFE